MPAVWFEPRAHSLRVPRGEWAARVAPREPVAVRQRLVVLDRDDLSQQADVPVPAVLAASENRQGNPRIARALELSLLATHFLELLIDNDRLSFFIDIVARYRRMRA